MIDSCDKLIPGCVCMWMSTNDEDGQILKQETGDLIRDGLDFG